MLVKLKHVAWTQPSLLHVNLKHQPFFSQLTNNLFGDNELHAGSFLELC